MANNSNSDLNLSGLSMLTELLGYDSIEDINNHLGKINKPHESFPEAFEIIKALGYGIYDYEKGKKILKDT
jgi:hypothetical protein